MIEPHPVVRVFDDAAGSYDNVGVDFFTPLGEALVRAVAPRPGERVLDVGCGAGAVLLPAAAAVGPDGRVTGIDLAPGMVARAAAATAHLPNVTVRAGDAQAPAFPDGSFDVVTAGLVLFFLPDPPAALVAYRRLLRPAGRLAFTSFAAHDPRYPRAVGILARYADDPPERPKLHPMFDSADRLRAAVLGAGFATGDVSEVVVHSRFRDVPHLVEWMGSHGGRQVVARIPAGRRAEAEAAVAAELTGPLEFATRVRVVLGTFRKS